MEIDKTDILLWGIAAIMLAMVIVYSVFLICMVDRTRETSEAIINAIYKTDSLELHQQDQCFYQILRICPRPHLDAAGGNIPAIKEVLE